MIEPIYWIDLAYRAQRLVEDVRRACDEARLERPALRTSKIRILRRPKSKAPRVTVVRGPRSEGVRQLMNVFHEATGESVAGSLVNE